MTPINSQSNAVPEFPQGSRVNDSYTKASPEILPAFIPTQPLYWSVRRELWENRSIYIVPLAVAGVFLFAYLISMVHLVDKMRAALVLDPAQQHKLIEQPYNMAELFIMGTGFIVAIFYCLDALHGERRDRSILFWKSLPVSDLTTVLSKASIPIVVLPLLTFAITVATQWIMLLVSSAVLMASGLRIAMPWTQVSLPQMWLMLFFHLLAGHGLYYAPIYGWLLLVSAWARRAPFLWATLPLVAIGIVEKVLFNTAHFAALLGIRIGGGTDAGSFSQPGDVLMHPLTLLDLGRFISSPGLWFGLAVAAMFLAAAVQLRRYRGPI